MVESKIEIAPQPPAVKPLQKLPEWKGWKLPPQQLPSQPQPLPQTQPQPQLDLQQKEEVITSDLILSPQKDAIVPVAYKASSKTIQPPPTKPVSLN